MKDAILSKYTFPAKPSSDGFYHIYVPDPAKASGRRQIKASTLEILKNKVYDIERGLNGNKRKTFEEVFNLMQEDYLKYIKNDEKRYSANNTVRKRGSVFNRFYKPSFLSSMYLDEITSKDIKDFCLNLLSENSLTQHRFLNITTIIRIVFKFALDEELVDENPAATINYVSNRFKSMFVESTPIEERMYTDDQLEVFIEACHDRQCKKPHYITAYALEFQIILGLRRGEVCPIKWSDVHEDVEIPYIEINKELIRVEKTYNNSKSYCRIVNHTKTSMNRRIPIWKELAEFLERLKEIHLIYYSNSPFLFPGKFADGCIGLKSVYQLYFRICKENNYHLSKECIRGTHSFRRNFAKRIDNTEMASKLLGNQPRILKRNYYDGLDMKKALVTLDSNH